VSRPASHGCPFIRWELTVIRSNLMSVVFVSLTVTQSQTWFHALGFAAKS
jgi:hypothetical protein